MNNTELMRIRPAEVRLHGSPQTKYAAQWMQIAYAMKEASTAVRRKVGAAIITPSMGVFMGYNGTAPGHDNCCEHNDCGTLVTKDEVIHAEVNALKKMQAEGVITEGSVVYVTLSPCVGCADKLADAGIRAVYYKEPYRSLDGVEAIKSLGLEVATWDEVLGRPFVPLTLD